MSTIMLLPLMLILIKGVNASESTSIQDAEKKDENALLPAVNFFDPDFEEAVEFLFQRGNPDKNELRVAVSSLDFCRENFLIVSLEEKKRIQPK